MKGTSTLVGFTTFSFGDVEQPRREVHGKYKHIIKKQFLPMFVVLLSYMH